MLSDEFAPIEAINREIVLRNTWGHLAPKPGQKYHGYIIVAAGVRGDSIIFDYDFAGLDDSPWFGQDLSGFVFANNFEVPALYRFEGWYKKFKNGKGEFGGGKFVKLEIPGAGPCHQK